MRRRMLGQWETQGMILGDNSMVKGVCSGVEMEPSERKDICNKEAMWEGRGRS